MPDNEDEINEAYDANVAFWKYLLEGMDMHKKYQILQCAVALATDWTFRGSESDP